jgi:hypothetical protein
MLYIVVDPKFLYLPDVDSITTTEIQAFVARLLQWSKILQSHNVSFGITARCQKALKVAARSAFDKDALAKLTNRVPALRAEEILRASMPLVNELMNESYMDQLVKRTRTSNFEWEVVLDKILVSPKDYIDRLVDLELQNSFMEMLALVVYARRNQVIPIADFQNLVVLTTYNEDENEWANSTEYKLIVRTHVDVVIEKTVTNWQIVQNETQIMDTLQAIQSSTEIETVAPIKQPIKTVSAALDMAVSDFPNRLLKSRLAQRTASDCDYEKPDEIYNLLRGLVTVWLATYEQEGEAAAGEAYYNEFRFQYIPDESVTVNRNPRLRNDYIATIDNIDYFCGKHIRIGTGPRCVRINFEVRNVNGQNQIVLGRVGKHGANTLNR